MSNRKGFAVTYEIVTPESAEDGDIADNGYLVDGHRHSTAGMHSAHAAELEDLRERSTYWVEADEDETEVDAAVRYLQREGVTQSSGYPLDYMTARSWFTTEPSENYRTGGTDSCSFHPVGWSDDEVREIAERVLGNL